MSIIRGTVAQGIRKKIAYCRVKEHSLLFFDQCLASSSSMILPPGFGFCRGSVSKGSCCFSIQSQQRSILSAERKFSSSSLRKSNKTNQQFTNEKVKSLQHRSNEFMLKPRKIYKNTTMSLSNMAGNASFLLVTLAYLNTDVIILRLLAIGSMGFGFIFFYYRPSGRPMYVPMGWHAILLGVNIVMVTALIQEQNEANHNMHSDKLEIFQNGRFEARGFSRVEFLRLFDDENHELCQKIHCPKGHVLVQKGQINTKLYFVKEGTVSIQNETSQTLLKIQPNQFIGEMTFLNYLVSDDDDNEDENDKELQLTETATANAIVFSESAVLYCWDFAQLQQYFQMDQQVANAFLAFINHDLLLKLRTMDIQKSNTKNPHVGRLLRTTTQADF